MSCTVILSGTGFAGFGGRVGRGCWSKAPRGRGAVNEVFLGHDVASLGHLEVHSRLCESGASSRSNWVRISNIGFEPGVFLSPGSPIEQIHRTGAP